MATEGYFASPSCCPPQNSIRVLINQTGYLDTLRPRLALSQDSQHLNRSGHGNSGAISPAFALKLRNDPAMRNLLTCPAMGWGCCYTPTLVWVPVLSSHLTEPAFHFLARAMRS
ncbi:hypothetical protein [Phage silverpheasant213]|nr:hypothetical protein [Phage silverpheasant213]